MNVWIVVSLVFVFFGVIEYVYINVKMRKYVRRLLNRVISNFFMNGNNLILNGSIYFILRKYINFL